MELREIMTDDAEWIAADAPVGVAVVRLVLHPKTTCLLVGDPGVEPRGIVTAFDLLRAVARTAVEPGRLHHAATEGRRVHPEDLGTASIFDDMACAASGCLVRDVMSSPVVWVNETASLASVMDLLLRRRIDAVPVLGGLRVKGLVHRRAILEAIARATGAARA